MTPPLAGQPGHGSNAVLRRQPVRIVDGRFHGGYTDVYEIICPSCGDHFDQGYSEVTPRLQALRGPYLLEAALAAYHRHLGISWPARPDLTLQDGDRTDAVPPNPRDTGNGSTDTAPRG